MRLTRFSNLLICLYVLFGHEAFAGEKLYVPVDLTAIRAEIRTACTSDDATISVKRDHGSKGAAIHSDIVVDGKPVAELRPGQAFTFCLAPDEHIFGVAWSMMGGLSSNKREIAVDVRAGKTYAFRIFILHAQGATIERTAE